MLPIWTTHKYPDDHVSTQFELRCPVHPEDPTAWIEVVAFSAGRILGKTVLRLMAFPAGQPTDGYQRPLYTSIEVPEEAEERGISVKAIESKLARLRKRLRHTHHSANPC